MQSTHFQIYYSPKLNGESLTQKVRCVTLMDIALIKGLTDSGILGTKDIKINRDVNFHEQISHEQKPLSSQNNITNQWIESHTY
jgi:hypothetical protein